MTSRYVGALVLMLLTAPAAPAGTATKVTQQCDASNNTSALNGGFDFANGNAPTWNVSKVPFRDLLYPRATTRVYLHFMPWSCTPGCVDNDQVRRCNGHVVSGYDANDVNTVRRQVVDMISRGADGVIVDYYRAALEDQTTMKIRDEAELHENFEFAVMEDKENYKYAATPEARAQNFIADVAYINSTYFASAAYMRRNGRPVLFIFQDDSAVDWAAVRAGVRALGDPLLIFGNDFDHPAADGAFAWIDAADPIAALDDFYARARAHPGSLVWGGAFAGFDDRLATWGARRVVNRRGGRTWLDSFAAARRHYGPSGELQNIQVITFNDYDEGTEIESGIDNGVSIRAAIDGTTVSWTISGGDEATISRFRVFAAPYAAGEPLILRGEVPAGGLHSFDLRWLPGGDWEIFVQAQGQPAIRNHMAVAGRFTRGQAGDPGAPPRRRPGAPGGRVSIAAPLDCASVASPIHVVAVEKHGVKATMQIYLDGRLAVERANVDRLDEQITAAPGAHQIAAKAWYADGPSNPVTVDVAVATPPVTIALPPDGAAITTPIRVIADENTAAAATAMQIYLDGTLYLERPNVEHLDEQVVAGPGAHQIAAKAWYADGSSHLATASVTASGAPVTISSPANGATVTSPIRVVADAPGAGVMQIYVDGTLYLDRPGVQHLDEQVVVGDGAHDIAAKAWYADGCSKLATVRVTVIVPVTISSPANGATVTSPFRVVADAPGAGVMQIYLDGSLYVERPGVHLDEQVTAAPGAHEIAAKAWYADGSNALAIVAVTVR